MSDFEMDILSFCMYIYVCECVNINNGYNNTTDRLETEEQAVLPPI